MKFKVIGWTHYDNMHFAEGENTSASHAAIIADIREHGYDFTGWHHQECDYGAPILNDGKIRRYSQRGWGGLMADVHEDNDHLYSYSRYAFSFGKNGEPDTMPTAERDAEDIVYKLAAEMLNGEEYSLLFEEDYTTRFPKPELGDFDIYTLTKDEADSVSCFDTVRQLPNALMRRLVSEDLAEIFNLDQYECQLKADRITLKMCPSLDFVNAGDTVVLNGTSYLVKDVDQYKDVPEKIRIKAMYSTSEGHDEAVEIYKNAAILIDIFI